MRARPRRPFPSPGFGTRGCRVVPCQEGSRCPALRPAGGSLGGDPRRPEPSSPRLHLRSLRGGGTHVLVASHVHASAPLPAGAVPWHLTRSRVLASWGLSGSPAWLCPDPPPLPQVVKVKPNDKDAKLKYQECNKIVKQKAFERAIASDEHKRSVVDSLDIESMSEWGPCGQGMGGSPLGRAWGLPPSPGKGSPTEVLGEMHPLLRWPRVWKGQVERAQLTCPVLEKKVPG